MNIYKKIYDALLKTERGSIATIVATSGSTPAPAQSRMLVPFDSSIRSIGTVGGGCLDESVISAARAATDTSSKFLIIELNDDVGDTGLSCGGKVTIFIEAITAEHTALYKNLIQLHESGSDCFFVTILPANAVSKKMLFNEFGNLVNGELVGNEMGQHVLDLVSLAKRERRVVRERVLDAELVVEYLEAPPRLFIFGGGHVGKVVSECASIAGFQVTVVDDRRAYANRDRFPEAHGILCESFGVAFSRLDVTSKSFVVIVTRGHKHDELVLEQAIQFNPRYIGMIGSKRKIALTFENLESRGVSREKLLGVHAPIGLSIGAITAQEIGISIVAELVSVWRKRMGDQN